MKAKELMLYDWVQLNGVPFRVKKLTTDGVIELMHSDGSTVMTSSSFLEPCPEFKPITITAEIMDKNDWCDARVWWDDKEDVYRLITLPYINIKYVHELQHILRICGFVDIADNLKIE